MMILFIYFIYDFKTKYRQTFYQYLPIVFKRGAEFTHLI